LFHDTERLFSLIFRRYELIAGLATNAVALETEEEYDRACRMLSVSSRLYDDLRATLRETLGGLLKKQQHPEDSASLEMAFSEGVPVDPSDSREKVSLSKLGKQGSVVKAVARCQDNPAGRASSLLRLTRERESTTSQSALSQAARRSGSGDVIIHHLGVDDEDSAELFGLLESSALRNAGDDSISRLIASVQSRRERRAGAATMAARRGGHSGSGVTRGSSSGSGLLAEGSAGNSSAGQASQGRRSAGTTDASASAGAASRDGAPAVAATDGGAGDSSSKTNHQLTKEALGYCDRLWLLMTEAERESYALRQRISAWRRMETDALKYRVTSTGRDASASPSSSIFEPSHCSVCSGSMATHLLQLWLCMMEAAPDAVAVSEDLIHRLLPTYDDGSAAGSAPPPRKKLEDAKRRAVRSIAMKSPRGSALVLDALRTRLRVTESIACSEILASIVEDEQRLLLRNNGGGGGGPPPTPPGKTPFRDLALEVLAWSTATDLS